MRVRVASDKDKGAAKMRQLDGAFKVPVFADLKTQAGTMSPNCECTSSSCPHHPKGGPCNNQPRELDFSSTPDLGGIVKSESEYGLCAACWLALEGTY